MNTLQLVLLQIKRTYWTKLCKCTCISNGRNCFFLIASFPFSHVSRSIHVCAWFYTLLCLKVGGWSIVTNLGESEENIIMITKHKLSNTWIISWWATWFQPCYLLCVCMWKMEESAETVYTHACMNSGYQVFFLVCLWIKASLLAGILLAGILSWREHDLALYPGLGKRLSMIKHSQYVINMCTNNVCLRYVYVQTFCRIACVDCVYMLCHNLHCSCLIWSYSVHFHLTSCPWNSLSTRLMNIDYYCKRSRKLRQWGMRLQWFKRLYFVVYTFKKFTDALWWWNHQLKKIQELLALYNMDLFNV